MVTGTRRRKIGVKELRLYAELVQQSEMLSSLHLVAPPDWAGWHASIFGMAGSAFAPHHREFWDWVWEIELGAQYPPFVGIWARGGAKSTNAERAVVALGARGRRKYCLYVSGTQKQADEHVDAIEATLGSHTITRHYPDMGKRATGKYGASKGWKRSRLRTASGFTVDALGMDTAMRGLRVEEYRPDLIIFDDIDAAEDTAETIKKKIRAITRDILPAGSKDVVVLFMQNLIHEDSIANQLVTGEAKFLINRHVSGPHKAIDDLITEQRVLANGLIRDVIVSGTPTWAGQGYRECQHIIDTEGLEAFLVESQHEVAIPLGGLFDGIAYRRVNESNLPDFVDTQVWCDPAVTDNDNSDSHGITVASVDADGIVYIRWSWEERKSPGEVIKLAIRKAIRYKASCVGVETDQGGDLWEESYDRIAEEWEKRTGHAAPRFESQRAGSIGSKVHRANMMVAAYKRGAVVHVINDERTHELLEKAHRRFPKRKPFDLVDSEFWGWYALAEGASLPSFY